MTGPPKRRKGAPPGGSGTPHSIVLAASFDISRDNPQAPKKQAFLRHPSDFARAAVFESFGYRHGRALDYLGFVDRKPKDRPLTWRAW